MITRRILMPVGLSIAIFLEVLLLGSTPTWSAPLGDTGTKIKAFVSILPQAYFVERIGGDRVEVFVMVGPGHSPATYEPMPMQMAELARAALYFRMGVPFENVWIRRISRANPKMKIIDTRQGVQLLPLEAHDHGEGEPQRHDREGLKDPHIWLSLRRVKIQARNICRALIGQDPVHRTYYEDKLAAFDHDLDELDRTIADLLKGLKTRKFMIFHPALGYFARDYGLEQVAIEVEGKEPTARTLARLIEEAKERGVRVIFVQKQFSTKSAEAVARAIGGKVAIVDPLAKEYLKNMRTIAEAFAEVME